MITIDISYDIIIKAKDILKLDDGLQGITITSIQEKAVEDYLRNREEELK